MRDGHAVGLIIGFMMMLIAIYVISTLPDCRDGEVMVRGGFGYVCVSGHR